MELAKGKSKQFIEEIFKQNNIAIRVKNKKKTTSLKPKILKYSRSLFRYIDMPLFI